MLVADMIVWVGDRDGGGVGGGDDGSLYPRQ